MYIFKEIMLKVKFMQNFKRFQIYFYRLACFYAYRQSNYLDLD